MDQGVLEEVLAGADVLESRATDEAVEIAFDGLAPAPRDVAATIDAVLHARVGAYR